MKKLLLIANIHSGRGEIASNLASIIDVFTKNGYDTTVYTTQYRSHATELVREKGLDYPIIVCCGGDGTLSEVVAGVMFFPEEKRPFVGYIPAGSTNDYAATLGLPEQMRACAEMIANNQFRQVDVGRFQNQHYFVYVAAFGAFTEVSWATPQEQKNRFGHMAYILYGIQEMGSIRPHHLKVTLDSQVIERDFVFGMVYNAKSVGGVKNISGHDVELDDGYLDIMLVIAPDNGAEWPELVMDFMTKNQASSLILSYRAKKITFESEENISWTLDGENGGEHKKVLIETCPQALTIAADPDEEMTV